MQTSLSTVMMAVLTTNAFLILLVLCLVNEKLLVHAGHKLLALFVSFTALRFVLPIELPFTITIELPAVFSQIIKECHNRLFRIGEQSISLWQLFKVVWLLGFIIGLVHYIISYYRSAKHITLYGKELTNTEPYKELLNQICEAKGRTNRFRVIELPGLDVPALFGLIHPRILVPERFELPRKQLNYILQHEATHHFNHDLFLKSVIKIITLAYWWDIFSWLLNRQTDVILEMRIDNALTTTDASITQEYMHCLIDMTDRATKKKVVPGSLTIGVLRSDYRDLKQRFQLMMNNQNKPQVGWNILLFLIAITIYLASYSIILEGYTAPEDLVTQDMISLEEYSVDDFQFPTADNSYFIDNLDGTYDLYMDGTLWETIDSLAYYPEDIPVYTKETAPQ